MIEKVKKTIEKYNLLKKGDHVIVGVSGGPDSISLLYVLFSLRKEFQLKLSVVHINHLLRGKDSDEDAAYVKKYCENIGIPFYSYKINIKKISRQLGISEEEAGRKARYDTFHEVLKKVRANKIAIAQNMNDQAETLLMRLTRGSGLDGLSGIDYIRDNTIIRPLLDITRSEIELFCQNKHLHPRIDKTNLKAIYTRNKIRLELIPYLEENFNSNMIYNLWKTAKILQEDRNFLQEKADHVYQQCAIESYDKIHLNKTILHAEHPSIKKRLLLKAAGKLNVHKDIGTIHLDNILKLIESDRTSSRLDLPEGLKVQIGYEDVVFSKAIKNHLYFSFYYPIRWGENINIKELNAILKTEIVENNKTIKISKDPYIKCFDYEKITQPLIVRTRKKGDLFSPLGMRGSKKLKDFFIDEKIPGDLRDQIPLISCAQDILWVIGYRMSEKYKVDEKTKKILVLEFKENQK